LELTPELGPISHPRSVVACLVSSNKPKKEMLIICQFGKLQPPADKKNRKGRKNRKIKELSLRVKRAEIKVARRRRIAFYNFRSSAGYILAFQRREARIYADNPAKRNPDLARVIAQLIWDESTLPDCCLHLKLKEYCNTKYCKF